MVLKIRCMFPILRKSLRYSRNLSSSDLINFNALKKGKLYYFLESRFSSGESTFALALRLYEDSSYLDTEMLITTSV